MDRLARFFEPLCVKQPVTLTKLLGSANGFHHKTLEIAAGLGAIRRHVGGIVEAAITHFLLYLAHYSLHIYLHPVPSYQ
jgi:hypothetical protein